MTCSCYSDECVHGDDDYRDGRCAYCEGPIHVDAFDCERCLECDGPLEFLGTFEIND